MSPPQRGPHRLRTCVLLPIPHRRVQVATGGDNFGWLSCRKGGRKRPPTHRTRPPLFALARARRQSYFICPETTEVVPNFALVLARDKGQGARVYNSLASSRGPVSPCLCSGPNRLDCSSVLLGNLYSGSGCERFRFSFLHQFGKNCREYVPIFTVMDDFSESSILYFHAGFF